MSMYEIVKIKNIKLHNYDFLLILVLNKLKEIIIFIYINFQMHLCRNYHLKPNITFKILNYLFILIFLLGSQEIKIKILNENKNTL